MVTYSQGVCEDGAAILRDGEILTVEEILELLRSGYLAECRIVNLPRIHTADQDIANYIQADLLRLNRRERKLVYKFVRAVVSLDKSKMHELIDSL